MSRGILFFLESEETMAIINKLTDIYTDWIDKNKLENASADEVLMGTPNLTEKQKEWLKEFIEVWDKGNDVERWLEGK